MNRKLFDAANQIGAHLFGIEKIARFLARHNQSLKNSDIAQAIGHINAAAKCLRSAKDNLHAQAWQEGNK